MPTSRLEVDLAAIDRNLALIREVVAGAPSPTSTPTPANSAGTDTRPKPASRPAVGICAVIKQDAYGAGAVRIAKRLVASGVEMLSVYALDEARALADAVPSAPILILMPTLGVDRNDPLYRHASTGRIHLSLHNHDQFNAICEMAARIGVPMPVHVQVDTGLSRGGVTPELAHTLVDKVLSSTKVRLAGLFTHFASPCCDEAFTREQARLFRDFVEGVKPMIRSWAAGLPKSAVVNDVALHAANSCATFRSRSLHGSMVRPGQALLGYTIDDAENHNDLEFAAHARRLQPALRWTSGISHIAEIPPGWPVGYGSTWRAPVRSDGRKTRIALVPVGYADGYPRSLGGRGNGGPGVVALTGRIWDRQPSLGTGGASADIEHAEGPTMTRVFAPVVGRVSMDQITIDVTDVPEAYLQPHADAITTGTGAGAAPSAQAGGGGGEVELYSRIRGTPNFLPTLAQAAGTITHELITRIGARVARVYAYPAHVSEGASNAGGHDAGAIRVATGVGGGGASTSGRGLGAAAR